MEEEETDAEQEEAGGEAGVEEEAAVKKEEKMEERTARMVGMAGDGHGCCICLCGGVVLVEKEIDEHVIVPPSLLFLNSSVWCLRVRSIRLFCTGLLLVHCILGPTMCQNQILRSYQHGLLSILSRSFHLLSNTRHIASSSSILSPSGCHAPKHTTAPAPCRQC